MTDHQAVFNDVIAPILFGVMFMVLFVALGISWLEKRKKRKANEITWAELTTKLADPIRRRLDPEEIPRCGGLKHDGSC